MNVLLVEDDTDTRLELADAISSWGYGCHPMSCAEEALQFIRSGEPIDLVLFDINMPGTTGLEMLQEVRGDGELGGDALRAICMTGEQDPALVITAIKYGISDFHFKPVQVDQLKSALRRNEIELKEEQQQRSELLSLQEQLAIKSGLLEEMTEEIRDTQRESLLCLAIAAEHKDSTTGEHVRRIGAYARRMGELLGWSEDRCMAIELAAPLHDVGKIGVADGILGKKGSLSEAEYTEMKDHTSLGAQILSSSSSPVMRMGAKIALCHHEYYDGSGYPRGLVGNQIPIEAAVTTLIDVYDALRSSRPYKDTMAHSAAIDVICNGDDRTSVSQFNPEVLAVFLRHHRDFEAIYKKCTSADAGSGEGELVGPVPISQARNGNTSMVADQKS